MKKDFYANLIKGGKNDATILFKNATVCMILIDSIFLVYKKGHLIGKFDDLEDGSIFKPVEASKPPVHIYMCKM